MNNGNGNAVTVTECVVCGQPSYGRQYCSNACKMRNYRQSNGKLLSIRKNEGGNEFESNEPEEKQELPVKQSAKWRTEITDEDWQDQELLAKQGMDGWPITYILFFKCVSGLKGELLARWVSSIASTYQNTTLWEDLQEERTYIGKAFKEFQIQYYKPKQIGF